MPKERHSNLPKGFDVLMPGCWPLVPPLESVPVPVVPSVGERHEPLSLDNRPPQWNGCDLNPGLARRNA